MKGQTLESEAPTSTPISLTIDNGKYFSVVVDDVDAVQADIKLMDMFTNDAGEQMKIAIDSSVLNSVYSSAASANKGSAGGALSGNLNLGKTGAARQFTATTALDCILDAGLALDEQNVPEDGRWLVIPAWAGSLIKRSELRQAYLTGDNTTPLRDGKLGQIDRFTVYVSNNLTKLTSDDAAGTWHCMAGTRDAISFASQITNVETLRAQSTFGNIVRGLNVYGFAVTKPEALVDLYIKK